MSQFLTQNFFELFDIPLSFDIDLPKLEIQYRDLQRTLHPDRFANASDQERRISVQNTAQLNEAFQTLKSAPLRARYLLQLKGIEFDDEKDTTFDPAFLMEQMELREKLADIKQTADPMTELADFLQDISKLNMAMVSELATLFSNDNDEYLNEAKQVVQKIRFLNKLQQEAEELEEDLLASY
ncbi:MAG: Fe-S protein assembly co-chaperone HscB [Gammaproteobacteria bacterium]|nr:Fe-S protein assembly co-chaperone HscB [Gammaproteobacteria bacterium]